MASSRVKNVFINLSVMLTILVGIESILIGYNHQIKLFEDISNSYGFISPAVLQFHRTLSVVIGFSLIFISYRLYKRMRMAWIISICMASVLVLMHILKPGNLDKSTMVSQLILITILAANYKSFRRASDPISHRNGIFLGLSVLGIIIINIFFTIYILKNKTSISHDIYNSAYYTIKMLFLMDPSVLGSTSKLVIMFAKYQITLNWTGIIAILILILKPLLYQPISTGIDRERVRRLVLQYGENPVSYVAVEEDKKYYFGKEVEGVIAYVAVSGVAVCVGDPVCSYEVLPFLITEFMGYCRQNDLDICFCNTLERNIPLYTQFGFGSIKCGEETMFDLGTYSLAGGKAAKIRNAINHATALGVSIMEYMPLVHRDKKVELQIQAISKSWLENKKSSELSFMLGSISVDNPMDRRYFAAYDSEDNMLGFIVFTPFSSGQGYYADVTRRRSDAPIGVMEKITIEAFEKMKSEGVRWGSLGLAPLVNVREDGKITERLLGFVYEKLNSFYGFKSLYHYKKKYGCTSWESRYFVYYPKIFTPKIAYSIIKAQNPKCVSDFLLIQLKTIFNGK